MKTTDFYFVIFLVACFILYCLTVSNNTYRRSDSDEYTISPSFLREFYSKQADARVGSLRSIKKGDNYLTFYNVLAPEALCPNMVRIGGVLDGGKWVCNPKAMPQSNCSIYSFGLANNIGFDVEIQKFNGNRCKIYGYDQNQQGPSTLEEYEKINGVARAVTIENITDVASKKSTIADLMKENKDKLMELMKIDIEGAEFRVLPPFLDQFQPCQIFMEIHGTAAQMRDLLVEIAKRDYLLFNYENNGWNLNVCEYSLVHRSCLEKYGFVYLASYLSRSVA